MRRERRCDGEEGEEGVMVRMERVKDFMNFQSK